MRDLFAARAEVLKAEAQAKLVEKQIELEMTQQMRSEFERLRALNAELVEALRLVTVYCGNLHHAKGDRHPMGEPCPVEAKIRAALAKVETANE